MIKALKSFLDSIFMVATFLGSVGGLTWAIWNVWLVHYGPAADIFGNGLVHWLATHSVWYQVALVCAGPFLGCIVVGAVLGLIIYVIIVRILDYLDGALHG